MAPEREGVQAYPAFVGLEPPETSPLRNSYRLEPLLELSLGRLERRLELRGLLQGSLPPLLGMDAFYVSLANI